MKPNKKPNQEPTLIHLEHGVIEETSNGFIVPITARLNKGNGVIVRASLTFKQDNSFIKTAVTDESGEVCFNHFVALSSENKVIHVRAIYGSLNVKLSIPIPKKISPEIIDAEVLNVTNTVFNETGVASCDVHVIDKRGKGLDEYRVNAYYDGVNYKIDLDEEGHGIFSLPTPINPGEKVEVVFTVNDIKQRCVAKFFRPDEERSSIHGLIVDAMSHVPFLFFIPGSLVAIPLFFISLNDIFSKTMAERSESGDEISGIISIIWVFSCLLFFFFFLCDIAYFISRRKVRHYKQEIDVVRYRHNSSKDSFMGNLEAAFKEWNENRKAAASASGESSQSASHNYSRGNVPFAALITTELAAEAISGLIKNGGNALKKYFFKN